MDLLLSDRPVAKEPPSARPSASGRTQAPSCLHCGIVTAKAEDSFCCAGCAFVYRLIHDEGLENYYRIKDSTTIPADAVLLQDRAYEWMNDAQKAAESSAAGNSPELRVDVQGISCAGCVWLIERVFRKQRGAGRIEVNAQTGQMRFSWERETFDAAAFGRTLQSFNYLLSPASAPRSAPLESSRLVRRIGLAGACSMNVMLFTLPTYFGMDPNFTYARLFGTLSFGFAALSVLGAGEYFIGKAIRSLREGTLSIDVPIALGIVGAFVGSSAGWWLNQERYVYFDFVAAFILLMLVGRWAQLVAVERNQRRLLAEQPTPDRIDLEDPEGKWIRSSPETLKKNQRFAVEAGQMLPVEARLEGPDAEFSLAWINGEAEPRVFHSGQRVPSGAMNVGRGEIKFRALEGWSSSLLHELTKPVKREGFRHRFLERVIQGYLLAIVGTAFVSGAVWFFSTGDALKSGAVVTAVLVVSCPCAIGLAFPLAEEIATVALRRRGVFVRDLQLWPRLRKIRHVVFDKTGTLTFDRPTLVNETALVVLHDQERRALLALVVDNLHPVARSLHEALLRDGKGDPAEAQVHETIGQGVEINFAGANWRLGRKVWAGEGGEKNQSAESESEVYFCRDGRLIAAFSFAESVRHDVSDELKTLRARGLRIHVLSGDRQEKVSVMVARLGLDPKDGYAEMTPSDKAKWVERCGANSTLVLGDGANDSLAFDQALCRGTPVVHRSVLAEKADFYYLGRGIGGVRALLEIDDARRQTQNALLIFSIAYNVCAVGLAAAGHMSPLIAAILMPVSSLLTLAIVGFGMRGVRKVNLR